MNEGHQSIQKETPGSTEKTGSFVQKKKKEDLVTQACTDATRPLDKRYGQLINVAFLHI